MPSLLAKMSKVFMRKYFNMNPECGGSFAKVADSLNKDTKKMKKGYLHQELSTPDGIKYELVKPISGANGNLVLYFHGGGYVSGLNQLYRSSACDFAKQCGGECILLDYTLFPAVFPIQHDQAYSLWGYVTDKLGYDPEKIIIGGDSAGGNLTMSLMLRIRDEGKKMPKAIIGISPWTDMTASGEHYISNYNRDPMFGEKDSPMTPEKRERLLKSDLYLWCGTAERTDPYVSPVYGDYKGFPTTLLTVGGDELLLDDTLTIAENMKKNGVNVSVIRHDGMFHIYPFYTAFPEGKDAYKKILAFIRAQLG